MCFLKNFILCLSDEHGQFLELSKVVLKLDQRDFEDGYKVDEASHPSKKIEVGALVKETNKGKRKAREFTVPEGKGRARPITIGSDDKG